MSDKTNFLKNIPIFSDLEENSLNQILGLGSLKMYAKDEIILNEDEAGTALFVIVKGKVKISRSSKDGKEVILTIMNESDFFGEMAILDGFSRSATVTALEESKLFIIQRNDFLALLKNHTEVSIALLQELTQRLRAAGMKIKALSLKDAEGKVASVILQLAEEIGKIKQGVVEIENCLISTSSQTWLGLREKQFLEHFTPLPKKVWLNWTAPTLEF